MILAQQGETAALDELARSCRQQAYVFALEAGLPEQGEIAHRLTGYDREMIA